MPVEDVRLVVQDEVEAEVEHRLLRRRRPASGGSPGGASPGRWVVVAGGRSRPAWSARRGRPRWGRPASRRSRLPGARGSRWAPGRTTLPVTSISRAAGGSAASGPTATIFSPRTASAGAGTRRWAVTTGPPAQDQDRRADALIDALRLSVGWVSEPVVLGVAAAEEVPALARAASSGRGRCAPRSARRRWSRRGRGPDPADSRSARSSRRSAPDRLPRPPWRCPPRTPR